MNEVNKYLYHHGILGQKWGKRNGPPYPLNPANRSSTEKKKNGKNYTKSGMEAYADSKLGLGGGGGGGSEEDEEWLKKLYADIDNLLKADAGKNGFEDIQDFEVYLEELGVKTDGLSKKQLESMRAKTNAYITFAKTAKKAKGTADKAHDFVVDVKGKADNLVKDAKDKWKDLTGNKDEKMSKEDFEKGIKAVNEKIRLQQIQKAKKEAAEKYEKSNKTVSPIAEQLNTLAKQKANNELRIAQQRAASQKKNLEINQIAGKNTKSKSSVSNTKTYTSKDGTRYDTDYENLPKDAVKVQEKYNVSIYKNGYKNTTNNTSLSVSGLGDIYKKNWVSYQLNTNLVKDLKKTGAINYMSPADFDAYAKAISESNVLADSVDKSKVLKELEKAKEEYTVKHSEDLYHHGILGQKWGKRNGPPYPLTRARNRAVRAQAKADKYQERATRKLESVQRREAKREERYYKRQEVAARIMNSAPAKLFFDGWDDSKWKQDRMTYEQIKKRNQERLNSGKSGTVRREMTDKDRVERMTDKDWAEVGDTSNLSNEQYVKKMNDYWDKHPDRFRTKVVEESKSTFDMSNDELRSTIDRIKLENEFNRLINENTRISNESNNLNSSNNSSSFKVPTDNPAVAKGRQYINDLNKDVGNYVKVGTDIVKLINNIYDTKNKLQGNPSNNTKNDLDNIINDRIEEALTKKQ